ncbi:MAG: UDP-N-acetylmuramate dehydrogenase [Pseudomonadota bacterium]|nr:UDP-N-acetylmuramate dehydrogenase [Pseudomonadota bacterium]
MARTIRNPRLIQLLPKVRGVLSENVNLAKLTWFRVGGPAEVFFRPADELDLKNFLEGTPEEIPITILGVCSNLLIRDGGIPGVTIRLGHGFNRLVASDNTITSGAAVSNLKIANFALDKGLTGLEFLSGIPGSLGGSIRMNAGAYGSEIKDYIQNVRMISRAGVPSEVIVSKLDFGYRKCNITSEQIFLEATLKGRPSAKSKIRQKLDQVKSFRNLNQPIKLSTGGSTFVNPPEAAAWELIEKAGCRGLTRGDAKVSEKHCNFLINLGNATAEELEELGEDIRSRVYECSGIKLEWEIIRVGIRANEQSQGAVS